MLDVYRIQDGVKRHALLHADGTYKCFAKSRNERDGGERIFDDLREAAEFLVANPDWGIVMEPNYGIIYEDIVIVRR